MVRIRRALSLAIVALILAFSVTAALADDNGAGEHDIADLNSSS